MEKLAVISEILNIEPIQDADKIERATVLGWNVVVKKNLHQVGDKVVMIFPDTLIPKNLLDPTFLAADKIRLKTVKMKGQYSAGLVLPLSELRRLAPGTPEDLGTEVSVALGIEKWVAPASVALSGDAFPTHIISKTDEDNIRSSPEALEEARTDERFKNTLFVATLKCDGSSGTFIYKDGVFRVCSRNLELRKMAGNAFWSVAEKYKLAEVLASLSDEYALQGEVCGPGIQKNPMKLETLDLFIFNVKNLTKNAWLSWPEVKEFCNTHKIPHVREVTSFVITASAPSIEDLQTLANDTKYDSGRTDAEGIVIRPASSIWSRTLQKPWSLKVMNQPYDMKKG